MRAAYFDPISAVGRDALSSDAWAEIIGECMARDVETATSRLWPLVVLSTVIALSLTYVIMSFWAQWKALIILLYGVYVMGIVGCMPTRTPVGYSVSVGVFVGLVIPLGIWLVQGP